MKINIGPYLKGAGNRKIDIKINNFDTYSFDHTISLIILPALIQLKNAKVGVPSEFVAGIGTDMDNNYCFDFIKDDEDKVFDMGCRKWEEVLEKMIWSFQQILEDDHDSQYHHGPPLSYEWKEIGEKYLNPATGKMEKLYEMIDTTPEERWYDHVGHQLHDARIQEGLELFGKYIRSLWD